MVMLTAWVRFLETSGLTVDDRAIINAPTAAWEMRAVTML